MGVKLMIAVPSRDEWVGKFGMSLLALQSYCFRKPFPFSKGESTWRIQNKTGSCLSKMRMDLMKLAFKEDYTHVLFIDSDQTFPQDLAHRLLEHKKGVVACNIATKKLNSDPTARYQSTLKNGGELVYTTPEKRGLEKVWRVGTGIMLIDLKIFNREGMRKHDLFPQIWRDEIADYTGEDWGFCEILEKAGVNIWVDHDLSLSVGHIGQLNYGHDLVISNHYEEIYGSLRDNKAKPLPAA